MIADVLIYKWMGIAKAQFISAVERKVKDYCEAWVGGFYPFNFRMLKGIVAWK
jgi:hypothetical protein